LAWTCSPTLSTGARAQQPIQRVGAPEDMAGAMSYLASEDAGFVTGQTIFVCGGLVRA